MMMIILSIQQECGQNYVLDKGICTCTQKLSSNNSLCVSSCESINEQEVFGKCVSMVHKSFTLDGLCNFTNQCPVPNSVCKNNQCKCDSNQGFVKFNSSSCINCWNQGSKVSGDSCESCPLNQAVSYILYDNTCACKYEKQGFGLDTDPNQCKSCWSDGQIIQDHKCKSCDVGFTGFNNTCACNNQNGFVADKNDKTKCICDESKGYVVDSDPSKCKNCWLNSQEIVSHQCSACQSNSIWSSTSNSCVCDLAFGFVPSQNGCQSCWANQMIIQQSKCVLCKSQFPNSAFDQITHTCVCIPGYLFKNGGCVKKSSNKTVAIAVAVPVAIVLVTVLASVLIIKKKTLKQNVQTKDQVIVQEPEVQVAQEISLPEAIDENVDVVPEVESK
ncbi:Growth_factor receptor cysteine-rich domain superfamily [Hexamita inflata]|uniref:Growth factor receptor cysteine-rich domain superfamily n=1 Tax=Hexamita inflata TaxID=28002 RepID=A0AA86P0T6_9EUKA|nr:Growth factor receptor cysteine-rich domain superfamily [Hexamita inflata]CAI9976260.1 Growth factor receptor cysteine-rich domain superfamily [Hexamita inflata]CAI9976262.1 Growth factor receptor cysteine-rich domain superfamily [Hexamita inflata]CAI9976264.1 Growth factor receptor cysteine-rich domain superfamily [Hexamita inflata]